MSIGRGERRGHMTTPPDMKVTAIAAQVRDHDARFAAIEKAVRNSQPTINVASTEGTAGVPDGPVYAGGVQCPFIIIGKRPIDNRQCCKVAGHLGEHSAGVAAQNDAAAEEPTVPSAKPFRHVPDAAETPQPTADMLTNLPSYAPTPPQRSERDTKIIAVAEQIVAMRKKGGYIGGLAEDLIAAVELPDDSPRQPGPEAQRLIAMRKVTGSWEQKCRQFSVQPNANQDGYRGDWQAAIDTQIDKALAEAYGDSPSKCDTGR